MCQDTVKRVIANISCAEDEGKTGFKNDNNKKNTMTMMRNIMKTDPAKKAEGGVFRNLLTHRAHSLVVELGQECQLISTVFDSSP